MVNPILVKKKVSGFQELLDIQLGKIALGVFMDGGIEAGDVLSNGMPYIAAFFIVTTRTARFEAVPAIISDWRTISHAISLAVDFNPALRNAPSVLVCSIRRKGAEARSWQTGSAVDIRAHCHTLTSHLGQGV